MCVYLYSVTLSMSSTVFYLLYSFTVFLVDSLSDIQLYHLKIILVLPPSSYLHMSFPHETVTAAAKTNLNKWTHLYYSWPLCDHSSDLVWQSIWPLVSWVQGSWYSYFIYTSLCSKNIFKEWITVSVDRK